MASKKLKKQELEKIKAFENLISEKVQELGIASYEEVTARNRVVSITEDLNRTAEEKNEYYSKLRDAYGDGTIDLSEGVFTSTPPESAE